MADKRDLLRQVRSAVHDPDPPPSFRDAVIYSDEPYVDALHFALNKLNLDLRNLTDFLPLPPWTFTAIPETLTFLLIKLATIQMAQMRGAEAAGSVSVQTEAAASGIQEIEMPDLRVKEHNQSTGASDTYGPGYWRMMWDRLQKEYDDEKRSLVNDQSPFKGQIQQGVMQRYSVRTGALARKELDRGLPASTLSVSFVSPTVSAEWAKVYDDTFQYYRLYHQAPGSDSETVTTLYSNHDDSYEWDSSLAVGQHLFWLDAVNMNDIATRSNIVRMDIE